MQSTPNISLTGDAGNLNAKQRFFLLVGSLGLLLMLLATLGVNTSTWFGNWSWFLVCILLIGGVVGYSFVSYKNTSAGIKNNHVYFKSLTSRGVKGFSLGVFLTGFYIILYFYPHLLGLNSEGNNTGLVGMFDPLSKLLSGYPASQWFVYGVLYTLAVLTFGIKFIWKYRHNPYQRIRTISVTFFQLSFAFLIPEFMARLNGDSFALPYYDLKNIWPLNYYNFEQYRVDEFINAGSLGLSLLIFGVVSIFIITPILTYKYGKRWYCSWVCGCGGLAETAGDPFRHLSDKSTKAWKIERWMVHLVTVFVVVMTTAVISTYLGYDTEKYWLTKDVFLGLVAFLLSSVAVWALYFKRKQLAKDATLSGISFTVILLSLVGIHFLGYTQDLFLVDQEVLRGSYGFLIGSIFSGVIGTGFYPILGNRVWCRFGCPMAAILGFQQRLFSKFRITTNGGQCISCGNCSTYCEMGIDVRAYAQRGENIVRSSCVGCGVCAAVCPRGVLKLENESSKNRLNEKDILLGNDFNLVQLTRKS